MLIAKSLEDAKRYPGLGYLRNQLAARLRAMASRFPETAEGAEAIRMLTELGWRVPAPQSVKSKAAEQRRERARQRLIARGLGFLVKP